MLWLNRIRDPWKYALATAIGVFAFQVLIVKVFSTGMQQATQYLPHGLQAFFGIDRVPVSELRGFLTLAYQHPFILAALLAVPIAIASGNLAGEVEKRTIAFLLARPISPVQLVLASTLSCFFWTVVLVAAAVAGTFVGVAWFHTESPNQLDMWRIALNLWSITFAISCLAVLFSAWSSERGDAIGWPFTVSLIMYVWSFLGQIWPAARPYLQYSLFYYYQPPRIFLLHQLLAQDFAVLGGVALVSVVLACVIYRLRDFSV